MEGLDHLSLFSGIGGIDLAAHWAGFNTVAFCEQNKFCQQVLNKHWPEVPIFDDIFTLTAESLESRGIKPGSIKLISGGFPCQPYSFAGKRVGNADDRALWPEMFRVIREVRPLYVLGENVPGLISLALDGVLSDLESEGYTCQPVVLPACAVNAPHRRDRVFIMAHRSSQPGESRQNQAEHSGGTRRTRLGFDERNIRQPEGQAHEAMAHATSGRSRTSWQDSNQTGTTKTFSSGSKAMAYTGSAGREEQHLVACEGDKGHATGGSVTALSYATGAGLPDWAGFEVGQPNPVTEFERPDGREVERNFRGVVTGVSRRVDRLKALGNAVVPQQVYPILKAIADYEKEAAA